MKRSWLALLLAGGLTLSGCASMANRDYLSIQPHRDNLPAANDPSAYRAENYTALGEVIHSMVEVGLEEGVVHLSNYTPRTGSDVEADLADACAEVAKLDPLGAYAVDFIKHDKVYIVSYYEATLTIAYRRTRAQVDDIVSVTGTSAVRSEIQEALAAFASEKVLRVSYFTEDAAAILDLVRQAYYAAPQVALGMPGVEVQLYPAEGENTGSPRIVEIRLTYPQEQEHLYAQAQALSQRAAELEMELEGGSPEASARTIDARLRQAVEYSPDGGGNTAYSALVDGVADSEGLALAFQLLAQELGLESYVVSGTLEGVPHFWNIIALAAGECRHVDLTRVEGFGSSDADLVALGYQWDRSAYRPCGAQPPTEPTQPPALTGMIGALGENFANTP